MDGSGGQDCSLGRPPTAAAEKVAAVGAAIPDAFKGDAHAYLISIYKDPLQPMEARKDAAKAAIGYETPKLEAVEVAGDRWDFSGFTDEELKRLDAELERARVVTAEAVKQATEQPARKRIIEEHTAPVFDEEFQRSKGADWLITKLKSHSYRFYQLQPSRSEYLADD